MGRCLFRRQLFFVKSNGEGEYDTIDAYNPKQDKILHRTSQNLTDYNIKHFRVECFGASNAYYDLFLTDRSKEYEDRENQCYAVFKQGTPHPLTVIKVDLEGIFPFPVMNNDILYRLGSVVLPNSSKEPDFWDLNGYVVLSICNSFMLTSLVSDYVIFDLKTRRPIKTFSLHNDEGKHINLDQINGNSIYLTTIDKSTNTFYLIKADEIIKTGLSTS